MEILFVSDYVCPYCLVAKQALYRALAQTGIEANVRWQPFELTPEPNPQVDTYHDEHRKMGYRVLEAPCKAIGLDMKLPPKVIPRPYTRLAFEGWYYACDHGAGDRYNDLVYEAYFIKEQDIGKPEVLRSLAVQAGLDGDDFAAALSSGCYTRQVKNAVQFSREALQVQHVPTIYLDGTKISINDYTVEEMVLLLTGHAGTAGSFTGCSADGC